METERDNLISSSVDPVPDEWTNHQSARVDLDLSDHSSQTKDYTDLASNKDEIDTLFQTESNKHRPQNSPHPDQDSGSGKSSPLLGHNSSSFESKDQITTESEKGNRWETSASVSVHVEPYSRTDPMEDKLSSLLDQFLHEDTQPKGMLAVDAENLESLTPTPTASTTALCKYRWSKTVNTNCTDVGFYSSFSPNSPVLLTWNETEQVYFSDNVRIECGDYHGNLVVSGTIYPVEEFSVRSYTFEVDLYLKDDILNDAYIAGDSKNVHSIQEPKFHYADLASQQFPSINTVNSDISEAGSVPSSQPYLTSMKRDSPIGDVDSGHLFEFSSMRTNNDRNSTDRYSDISKQYKRDSIEKTQLSETRKLDLVEDILSRPTSVPMSNDGEISTLKRANSFSGLRSSSASIAAHGTQLDSSNKVLQNDTLSLSNRPSPLALQPYSRAEYSSLELTAPTADQRLSSSQTQLSYREISTNQQQWSKGSSGRSTPQADLLADPHQIYPERSTSQLSGRPPSSGNSRVTSRTTSVVSMGSEQELAQYVVNHNSTKDKYSAVGNSLTSGEFNKDTQMSRGSDRASSLPNYQPQHLVKLEGRSVTPDNKIRVPPADLSTFRNGLVTERMEDVLGRTNSQSSLASRGSSRSATPVASDYAQREIGVSKIQELEASVSNLRKLLTNREAEVHSLIAQVSDLKDINRSLREDLEHKSHRHSSSLVIQDSLEYKQLQREKEILASEVVVLREQVERLSKGQTSVSGRNSASLGIMDYSPNSPLVLQRKIADLEAHIKDLQEVTESTTANLVRAENTVKHLEQENKDLRNRSSGHTDLLANNELKNLKVEMRALQEDYRSIKERNLQLTEENMRLLDEQKRRHKERERTETEGSRFSSSLKSENGPRNLQDYTHSPYKSELSDPAHSLGSEKTNYNFLTSRTLSERDVRQTAQNFENERKVSDPNRLLHQRNSMESSRLRAGGRDAKPSDRLRAGMNYPDRSRPDGEVSENVYTDKYLKKSDDSRDRELATSSYLDKHYAALKGDNFLGDLRHRDDYDDKLKEDKYKYTKDSTQDVDSRLSSKHLTSTGPISSKDIFLNLQSRTRKWLNEVDSDQKVTEEPDSDSDSTEVLVKRSLLHTKHKAEIQEKKSNTFTSSAVSKIVKDQPNRLFPNDNKYISGNLDFNRYKPSGRLIDDTGDDSDTATDILLAQETAPRGGSKRRPSLGSDGTSSTLSDGDDDNLLRRRSKSVETSRSKESSSSRQLSSLPRGATTARSVTSLDTMRQSAGLRSVIPPPLVTQHNKGELITKNNVTSLLNSSLTQGLRPFAPRNIADIRIDDVVKFSRVGGKLTQGVVKYVGHLPGRSEAYLGVELDKDEGKHDGTFEGIRYFKCKPNKGVFVAFNKVVMAWAP